jgi:mannose-6-phosphate isomerase
MSVVAEGPLAGMTLRALITRDADGMMGQDATPEGQFPLLVKFLDAHQVLSVQVHPDDAQARLLANDNGKTEAWVILHADPGSLIYAGLQRGVDRQALEHALATGAVESCLHRFHPKVGDCLLIPAGTVHAIGAGIVLAEIQQTSDVTYRVHDWGRLGPDGKPRALHVAEALQVIDFAAGPVHPVEPVVLPHDGGVRERLVTCPFFRIDRWTCDGEVPVGRERHFTILIGIEGRGSVVFGEDAYPIEAGETLLLPAALGVCTFRPRGGTTRVLECGRP